MDRLFLLDAYALIYRSYYAMIRAPLINSDGFNTSAILGFVNTLEDLIRYHHPTHIGVAFDPGGRTTFRHEVYPDYKAQRSATPEVINQSIPIIKDIIRAYRIPLLVVPRYEADDVVGTLSAEAESRGFEVYMVTPDKDYGQLVTPHVFQFKPGKGGYTTLDPKAICLKYGISEPRQIIDILGLMGDSSDNIPGCPGVGEKTAVSLVRTYGSIENLYAHASEIPGKLGERLRASRRQVEFSKYLATICRDVPIRLEADALRLKQPDRDALIPIFSRLEFRSLLRSVCGVKSESAPLPHPAPPAPPVAPKSAAPRPSVPDATSAAMPLFASVAPESVPAEPSKSVENPADSPSAPDPAIFEPAEIDPDASQLIETESEARRIAQQILTDGAVAIEFALTDGGSACAEPVGIALATADGHSYYLNCRPEEPSALRLELLRPVFESSSVVKSGHSLKTPYAVLLSRGIELSPPLFDTELAHYLCRPELDHSLDGLSLAFLRHSFVTAGTSSGKRKNDALALTPDLRRRLYPERARAVSLLKPRLEKELRRVGALPLYERIELPLLPVLARMELGGVRVDPEALSRTARLYREQMNEAGQAVYQIAGHPFNLDSPMQVGEVLFGEPHLLEKPKRTASGHYKTSEDVLESLSRRFPIVEQLLLYREIRKLLSTYILALPRLINPRTRRVHTTFNQTVTATGRLSSSNPNLQNIPVRGSRGKEVRRAFTADEGCLFFSADYSQIELRIMAHLSRDERMTAAFLEGADIHAATAAHIYHKPPSEVTPEERRKAKTANFGIIYGITAFGLSQRIGQGRAESKELIESYFRAFPGVSAYIEQAKEEARRKGYVETLLGRRRYLPDINSRNATVRGLAERNAINAPIQGSAADLIKIAMVRIDERLRRERLRARMILQVHDELNFSVPPEEKEAVERIVSHEMEHAFELRVPLVADTGWGTNWLEAH